MQAQLVSSVSWISNILLSIQSKHIPTAAELWIWILSGAFQQQKFVFLLWRWDLLQGC